MRSAITPGLADHANGRIRGWVAAIIATVTTLIYAGMKVVMAIRGELGLPGFPPGPSSDTTRDDIARSEWMLVLLAVLAAGVALASVLPATRRVPRWMLATAIWLAGMSQAAGAIGMTLRATRILPDLGPGPTGWTTWVVLLVLDIGAIAWLVLAMTVSRRGHLAEPSS